MVSAKENEGYDINVIPPTVDVSAKVLCVHTCVYALQTKNGSVWTHMGYIQWQTCLVDEIKYGCVYV